jgi:hypothetical protein
MWDDTPNRSGLRVDGTTSITALNLFTLGDPSARIIPSPGMNDLQPLMSRARYF